MKSMDGPGLPAGVRRLFRFPFRSARQVERDMDDEILFHLELRIAELCAAGLSPEAARAEALRRFGDADELRAYTRAIERPVLRRMRLRAWLEGWAQDLGFALRQFRKAPGFTAVAVLTMALGIGANTAIFSAVHRLLLAPLPYLAGERLVFLQLTAAHGKVLMGPPPEVVAAWRARAHTLEAVTSYRSLQATLDDGAEPELLRGAEIAPDLPAFLGVRPAIGRVFAPQEARSGAPHVALLGFGPWQRRYGGRADVLGRVVRLDGEAYTIVGVMPRDFGLAVLGDRDARQLFTPLAPRAGVDWGGSVSAIGRLRPGISADAASRELAAIAASDPTASKLVDDVGAQAVGVREAVTGDYRRELLLLFGAVGLVLLIACANVANLLLARAWSRRQEFAVRAALGAGRARTIRQLLTESVVLALAGGALGVLLAWRGLRLIVSLRPPTMGALDTVRLDSPVLLWSLGLSLLTGVLFGLAPALFATGRGVGGPLKDATRTAAGSAGSRRFRGALVVGEIALSAVLLTGAGLLARSFVALQNFDTGFDTRGLLSVELALPTARFATPASRAAVFAQVVERARGLPGVRSAALATSAPPRTGVSLGQLEIEGRRLEAADRPRLLGFGMVQPEYFRTAGIPLLAGRVFRGDTTEHAVVVSRGFARRFFPAGGALGTRIRLSEQRGWETIVGVVGDVRSPSEPDDWGLIKLYEPFPGTFPGGALLVRTDGDAEAAVGGVARAISALDPAIHLVRAETTEQAMARDLAEPRFLMALLAAFALLALVLAAVGLYGVVAFAVSQRTREIGVRVAVGAQLRHVVRLVLGQAVALAGIGILLGMAGGIGATRAIRSMLFGVDPTDPLTVALVSATLLGVAVVASIVPLRRAMRIDPAMALRADG